MMTNQPGYNTMMTSSVNDVVTTFGQYILVVTIVLTVAFVALLLVVSTRRLYRCFIAVSLWFYSCLNGIVMYEYSNIVHSQLIFIGGHSRYFLR